MDTLLVRIHFIIVMIRWTGLALWEFEFPFRGSLYLPSLPGMEGKRRHRTVDHAPFIKSQLASTQATLGPCVVQLWARCPQNLRDPKLASTRGEKRSYFYMWVVKCVLVTEI